MVLSDYHLHTNYSIDSRSDMEGMIKKAISLGLEEIAFTDHQDFLPDGSDYGFCIDYSMYMDNLNRLRAAYDGSIRIIFGVELGLMPGLAERIYEFASKFPFEFIIGSSHDTLGLSHYEKKIFVGKDKKTAYMDYLLEIADDIKKIKCFDVFGHLDYIARYGIYEDNSLNYFDYSDIIDMILKRLIDGGKGLELNTSGIRYGLGVMHPQTAILKRYRELGGEIMTLGSDAHAPADICHSFEFAREILKGVGFKTHALFRNRKPYLIDL